MSLPAVIGVIELPDLPLENREAEGDLSGNLDYVDSYANYNQSENRNSGKKQSGRPLLPSHGKGGGGNDLGGTGNDRSGNGGSEACGLVVANLSAYLDSDLVSDEQRLIAAHLAKCPNCSAVLTSMQETDQLIQREWRDSAPLPSSFAGKQSIDSIMDSLPPVPVPTPQFTPKRVHSRTRWIRFASGVTVLVCLLGSLWYTYLIGYSNGRRSISSSVPIIGAASLSTIARKPTITNPNINLVPTAFVSARRSETTSMNPAAISEHPELPPHDQLK